MIKNKTIEKQIVRKRELETLLSSKKIQAK